MTIQVRCISPHGGGHHGIRNNEGHTAVRPVWDPAKGESVLPDIPPGKLFKPPNSGGYVMDARIPGGYAAVGQVYDVPDDFYADGFHWEYVELTPADADALAKVRDLTAGEQAVITSPPPPQVAPRTPQIPATPKPAEE